MDQLETGDLVKHLANGEEGRILKPVTWCIGTNKGQGYLVEVAGKEKVWLEHETKYFGNPKVAKPEEPKETSAAPREERPPA